MKKNNSSIQSFIYIICINFLIACQPFRSSVSSSINFEEQEPIFVTFLNPEDTNSPTDNSGNVIQGISALNNNWLISQDAGDGFILFNLLDSSGRSLNDWEVSIDSHGQDLSYLTDDSEVISVFSGNPPDRGLGIAAFNYNTKLQTFEFSHFFDLQSGFSNSTPTLNKSKTHFIIRGVNVNDEFDDRVFIYSRRSIENGSVDFEESFLLDQRQTVSEQWFQGIAVDNNLIYVLTGNSSIEVDKLIFVYDFQGNVIYNKVINSVDPNVALSEGNSIEPEGLSIKDHDLFFTINTGTPGNRTKRLYKIRIW